MESSNRVFQVGNIGIAVNKMQAYMNVFQYFKLISNRLDQDGVFGSDTKTSIQEFQKYAKLNVDGIVGENTWDAMIAQLKKLNVFPNVPVASSSYYLTIGSQDLSVYEMQKYLNRINVASPSDKLLEDGIYGTNTQRAVKNYQIKNGLGIDGVLGWKTWDSIINEYLNLI